MQHRAFARFWLISAAALVHFWAGPAQAQQPAAFEGIEFQGPSTTIRMALGKGHQGISETAYATYRFNKQEGKPELTDVVYYPAECINPPEGATAVAWLEGGMKGAKCK